MCLFCPMGLVSWLVGWRVVLAGGADGVLHDTHIRRAENSIFSSDLMTIRPVAANVLPRLLFSSSLSLSLA